MLATSVQVKHPDGSVPPSPWTRKSGSVTGANTGAGAHHATTKGETTGSSSSFTGWSHRGIYKCDVPKLIDFLVLPSMQPNESQILVFVICLDPFIFEFTSDAVRLIGKQVALSLVLVPFVQIYSLSRKLGSYPWVSCLIFWMRVCTVHLFEFLGSSNHSKVGSSIRRHQCA